MFINTLLISNLLLCQLDVHDTFLFSRPTVWEGLSHVKASPKITRDEIMIRPQKHSKEFSDCNQMGSIYGLRGWSRLNWFPRAENPILDSVRWMLCIKAQSECSPRGVRRGLQPQGWPRAFLGRTVDVYGSEKENFLAFHENWKNVWKNKCFVLWPSTMTVQSQTVVVFHQAL